MQFIKLLKIRFVIKPELNLKNIAIATERVIDGLVSGQLRDPELFEQLLEPIVHFTQSEFGFIGKIEEIRKNKVLTVNAISKITWNEQNQPEKISVIRKELTIDGSHPLVFQSIEHSIPYFFNKPEHFEKVQDLPYGFPEINSFMCFPFSYQGKLLGLVGVANRKSEYTEKDIQLLRPFINACALGLCSLKEKSLQDQLQQKEAQFNQEIIASDLEMKNNLEREQRLMELLGASERRFRAMIEKASDGIVLYDAKGCVIFGSGSAEKIAGYKLYEHTGRDGSFFIHPDDRAEASIIYRNLLQRPRESVSFQQRIIHAKGHTIWIDVTLTNLLDDADVRAVVSNFRDVSERKKNEVKLMKSEELYRGLFDHNPTPLWIFSNETKNFLAVNDAALALYEYSREEFLTMNLYDVRPEVERDKLKGKIQYEKQQFGRIPRALHKKKTGEPIWVDVFYTAIEYNDERCYLSQCIDVTEAHRNEQRVHQILQELEGFKEAVDKGAMIALVDDEGRFLSVSQAIEKITGLQAADFIGRDFLALKPKYHDLKYYRGMYTAIRRGQSWRGEYKGLSVNHEIFWLDVILTPIKNSEGKVQQYIAVCIPITDRKMAEEERDMLITDLLKKNQSLEEFAFITSHNLRAPVAQFLGLSQLFNREQLNDPFNATVMDNIQSAAYNLDGVIRDLTQILAIKKDIKENKELVDVGEVFDQVLESVQMQVNELDAQIECDFKGNLKIHSVKSYLYSIFINLLTNAIKYRSLDRKLIIKIKIQPKSDTLMIIFSDNGLGIDLKNQKGKIFGLYKRFHNHVEGKGLGLYLVKNQTEALGGGIEVSSKVGEGTTFTLRIARMLV